MSIPNSAQVCIRDVYDQDVLREFAHIARIKNDYPIISLDTEFPGVISLPQLAPTPEEHKYQLLKANVDGMKLIQVALTLTNEQGQLPMIDGAYCGAWQFNLRDFNLMVDIYEPSSIDILTGCGINFSKNRREGIDSHKFTLLLVGSDLVHNRALKYISYQGDYDFAYLLKLLTLKLLPNSEAEFKQKQSLFFGDVHDLRQMQLQHFGHIQGGLQAMANCFGIERIAAPHQAGSRSLATALVFHKIQKGC